MAGTLLCLEFTEAVGGGAVGWSPCPPRALSVVLRVTRPGRHPRELEGPLSLPLRAHIPSPGVVARSLSGVSLPFSAGMLPGDS